MCWRYSVSEQFNSPVCMHKFHITRYLLVPYKPDRVPIGWFYNSVHNEMCQNTWITEIYLLLQNQPLYTYNHGSGSCRDWRWVVADCESLLSHCLYSAAHSTEIDSWGRTLTPDLNIKHFFSKPNLHPNDDMAQILLDPNFFLLKIQSSILSLLANNISWTDPNLWDPANSRWICEPSSTTSFITFPTPHWISSLLPEFLSPLRVCVWPWYWVRLNWSVVPL